MLLPAECERCGGSKLEHGLIAGASFALRDTPLLKLAGHTATTSGLPITATACLDCGNLHLTTDIHQLSNLTGRPLPTLQGKLGPAKGKGPGGGLRITPRE